MTLEDLLECSADELEKLSDTELTELLAPYFKVTRPEIAGKMQRTSGVAKQPKKVEDWDKMQKQKLAFDMAAKMGIKLKPL